MLVERMLPVARKKLATVASDVPLINAAKILSHKEANLVVVCGDGGAGWRHFQDRRRSPDRRLPRE